MLVNIGLGNGLLPDGTKALSEPMYYVPSVRSGDIHLTRISQEISQPSITKINLKITYLKLHSSILVGNDLKLS